MDGVPVPDDRRRLLLRAALGFLPPRSPELIVTTLLLVSLGLLDVASTFSGVIICAGDGEHGRR
jgi:hypothetical protein